MRPREEQSLLVNERKMRCRHGVIASDPMSAPFGQRVIGPSVSAFSSMVVFS